jgi:Cu2+-exporting ATPase
MEMARRHGQQSHGGKHGGHTSHHEHMVADFKRRFKVSLALTVPVLALSPMIQSFLGIEGRIAFPGDSLALFLLASVVYFYGGWPFLKGLFTEAAARHPGMMTLIAVAITAAYTYSSAVVFGLPGKVFFWELVTLIDIMLLGHWIEMRSVMGASRALEELVRLLPSEAHLVTDDGSVKDVPVDSLVKGDRFLVKPGEKIPTDGSVIEGATTVNESMLTGESVPVSKGAGDAVVGGAINNEGSITVVVEKVGEETFLAQVVAMVREAQETRSRSQDLANRAAFWLTVIALSVGSLTLVVWLLLGQDLAYAMERMVTVMVITCPHALGLAVPLVVAVSTSLAASNGLLLRDRAAFERSRLIDAVVFDKTGTLTKGLFGVQGVIPTGNINEKEILRLASSVESLSEHPIARGIVGEAFTQGITVPRADDFRAVKGKGARAMVEGRKIMVASPGYLEEKGIYFDEEPLTPHYSEGRTVVFVLEGDTPLGAIALGDVIRPESVEAVERLHAMGISCVMLTGDHRSVAAAVSETLGLDDFLAEVLPDQKAAAIRKLMDDGQSVAMTGDGVNDAPALATADLGIAIGAGTDVAVETADVVLVRSDPRDVAAIFELARATYRKMVQNLVWATGYNIFAIPLAAGVLAGKGIILSPAMGALLMSLSTVVVAINARMLKMR